ncbi:hypothetical protein Trydic_g238 [Trypoxylus dichotomus]
MVIANKTVDYLVVDTTAFIENAPLQNIAQNIVTVQEVVNEITNKRQLRRLVALPYELVIKDVFPENIQIITEFAQKTGDYPNLSATDIKVMALTYQLEKTEVGTDHLRKEPIVKKTVNLFTKPNEEKINLDVTGFFIPTKQKNRGNSRNVSECDDSENKTEDLTLKLDCLKLKNQVTNDNLTEISAQTSNDDVSACESEDPLHDLVLTRCEEEDDNIEESSDYDDESDDDGWITPSNINEAKKQINSRNVEEKSVKVACITTDFAMQNVLKQMNLNVSALDGRIIKELKTYILRCYTCFKTTSNMMQRFCQKCGNPTLKRVSVSVDSDGKQRIHINARRPLTARGKKFSLPTVKGGKHSSNPILAADQPLPDQKPTRLARTKNNPLDDDYIAGYSPFVMRDVNSKSAQLGIRGIKEVKHWMKKNPNETNRRRK